MGGFQDRIQGSIDYFELDFPEITTKKAMTIQKHTPLKSKLTNPQILNGGCDLFSRDYKLLGVDLREFFNQVVPKLESAGFKEGQVILQLLCRITKKN